MKNPKIYFACSIRGGRGDADIYGNIVEYIKASGGEVLSEIFADKTLTPQGSQGASRDIWEKDLSWIRNADAIIAEVTNPSLGVGYEIAKAEEWGKPILALYRPQDDRKLSAMIDGSPYLKVHNYSTVGEINSVIQAFISQLR